MSQDTGLFSVKRPREVRFNYLLYVHRNRQNESAKLD